MCKDSRLESAAHDSRWSQGTHHTRWPTIVLWPRRLFGTVLLSRRTRCMHHHHHHHLRFTQHNPSSMSTPRAHHISDSPSCFKEELKASYDVSSYWDDWACAPKPILHRSTWLSFFPPCLPLSSFVSVCVCLSLSVLGLGICVISNGAGC